MQHIEINLTKDVAGKGITSGFERYRFKHLALPELNLEDVDTQTTFLGYALRVPLLVSSMTGGTAEGARINKNLALAAQRQGVAMGLGSGRMAVESVAASEYFAIRKYAPDILLFANLGAVQLNYGYTATHCQQLVDRLEANALILHLNPLQEAVQPEGDHRFQGLLDKIARVCDELSVPVVVKEVGWGLSKDVISGLLKAGVAAVDVAGAGGTSWSEVERYRGTFEQGMVAQAFADWGIPTAQALVEARQAAPQLPIVASGGVHSGVDAAKCFALGADLVGMASVLLKAAVESEDKVVEAMRIFEQQLRIAMFAVGASTLGALKTTNRLVCVAEP
uniref:type 2 isopentenyl-diphosphate Delta-isomerase n=1 Tax=Alicyclobacillus tolerans TaxID=90970 RepID=UPI001F0182C4|nr:type 2 isopentenyl-diphosphate Delta-isomerase [Alicyclobacillus tolerans]